MRNYGIANAAPYASAPAVGMAGDLYWDTGQSALFGSDGAAWNKVGPSGASSWTDSGTTLTPNPSTRTVTIVGNVGEALTFGSRTVKGRLMALTGQNTVGLRMNAGSGTTPDDATAPAWSAQFDPGDAFDIWRSPAAATLAWANLLKLDGTGMLSLPGPPAGSVDFAEVQFGSRTGKGRLMAIPTLDWIGLTKNCKYGGSTPAWSVDDATIASWSITLTHVDNLTVQRAPAGSTTFASPLVLDAAGNLTITGKLSPGATLRASSYQTISAAFSTSTYNAYVSVATMPNITTSGGAVLITLNHNLNYIQLGASGNVGVLLILRRSGTQIVMKSCQAGGAVVTPLPAFTYLDVVAAGTYAYELLIWIQSGTSAVVNGGGNWVGELTAKELG